MIFVNENYFYEEFLQSKENSSKKIFQNII
jgi:hypothetical protein